MECSVVTAWWFHPFAKAFKASFSLCTYTTCRQERLVLDNGFKCPLSSRWETTPDYISPERSDPLAVYWRSCKYWVGEIAGQQHHHSDIYIMIWEEGLQKPINFGLYGVICCWIGGILHTHTGPMASFRYHAEINKINKNVGLVY